MAWTIQNNIIPMNMLINSLCNGSDHIHGARNSPIVSKSKGGDGVISHQCQAKLVPNSLEMSKHFYPHALSRIMHTLWPRNTFIYCWCTAWQSHSPSPGDHKRSNCFLKQPAEKAGLWLWGSLCEGCLFKITPGLLIEGAMYALRIVEGISSLIKTNAQENSELTVCQAAAQLRVDETWFVIVTIPLCIEALLNKLNST